MDAPGSLRLTVVAGNGVGAPHVRVGGEVDLATAPQLKAALGDLVTATDGDLRIDCAELAFIDSSGVSVLVAIEQRLAAAGRRLVLRDPSEQFRQVLAVTALDDVFVLE
jgi:anti-sigma B factor antagonist